MRLFVLALILALVCCSSGDSTSGLTDEQVIQLYQARQSIREDCEREQKKLIPMIEPNREELIDFICLQEEEKIEQMIRDGWEYQKKHEQAVKRKQELQERYESLEDDR